MHSTSIPSLNAVAETTYATIRTSLRESFTARVVGVNGMHPAMRVQALTELKNPHGADLYSPYW